MQKILLGCIADDFTGATDLANNLVRAGMRVVQTIGVPTQPLQAEVDAVVVSLKSRTIDPEQACVQSVAALRLLVNRSLTAHCALCSGAGLFQVRLMPELWRHLRGAVESHSNSRARVKA